MKGVLRRVVHARPGRVLYRGIRWVIRRHVHVVAVAVVISLLSASLPATSSTTQAGARQNSARATAHSGESLHSQLYRGLSQTLALVGGWLASYVTSESVSSQSAYYPVAAFLTPPPSFIDAPTNLTVTAASGTGISLSWTASAGSVDHYQIERSTSVSGPFFFLANVSGTTHNDTTVSNLQAYLYRVRGVTSGGLPSAPSNMALGTAISFQFANLQGQEIRAQHFYDVRTAINAVRGVAGLSAATWTRTALVGLEVKADDVLELRTALNEALTVLDVPLTGYEDATLNTGANGTLIKAIHLEQLQTRSTRGASNSSGPLDSDSSTARLDPMNETGGGGENPLSRNFNWNLPLVSLPGRAGMNLGLTLSYNSLVWTRSGNVISFDDDRGFPGPGFRLGFPVIQPLYYNTEVGKYAFLLIGPDGGRTELRQVGTSALYEAADSSHLLLDSNTMVLRTADGTQLSYALMGNEFNCTQIKDRNGNYITINYTAFGRIDTVIDTLARSIKFNYDTNGWLTSITQVWNQGTASQVTHNWATFTYADITIQTNFSELTVYGPSNNSTIKMLSRVTLADGSHSDFSYTSWGQAWKVSNFAADNHLLNYRSYNLPQTASTAHTDCPRFTERRDWAQYWNGDTDGTTAANEEAVTSFIVPVSDTWTMPDNTQATGVRAQVTTPDGTIDKIYFLGSAGTSSGWRRGLPALVETHSGGAWQRKAMTTWTQDNTALSYILNPRVTETNVYDPAGNRARTQTTYQQFTYANGTSCHYPRDVYEYAANATTILRSTRIDYHSGTAYTDRRILGLVTERRLYEGDVNNGGTLMSKVGFFYDNENGASSIQGTDAPVQHDNTNYTASFVTGRANLSSVRRFDVTNTAQFTTTSSKYNTAGAVVSSKDASNHEGSISYADSFSDGNNSRNTLAYPTTMTDPDGYSSTSKYHFDFGAATYRRTPQPNTTQNLPGPEQTTTFDTIGRLQQVTNLVNNAYTRFEYPTSQIRVNTYTTIQEGLGEAHSFRITDGHGRVIATAADHPGSVGGFSGQKFVYDVMGRVIKTSNPTETSATGAPSQWTTAGDDAAAGWIYTEQTYDWKGRPLVTTNQDGTTKIATYSGCGCAGGEVVTLTDEGTIDAGVAKRRQQKFYSDVLGRNVKTEVLNWEGGSVYSATVNSYNARDQVTLMRQYAGPDTSTTFQDTTMTYDGYGRLKTRHVPEQDAGTDTVWIYNADDTIQSVTDARGASATYSYNNRHLVTAINYSAPSGITPTANVLFSYDAALNRTSMTDGFGSQTYNYNQLSQITSESRYFSELGQSYALSYEYNLAGQLKRITDATNMTINYGFDASGRLSNVTGADNLFMGITNYASNFQYRAWGGLKAMTDGSGHTSSLLYNSKLQPTHFNLSNGQVNQNYSYYNDGRLSFVQNTTDANFDRSYIFDHAARLTQAASGASARGDSGATPYYESFGYDSFSNLNSRYTRSWDQDQSELFDSSTYTNNRRSGWGYDANGNNTTMGNRTYQFDAAGQMRSMTGQQWVVDHYDGVSQAASYDGEGQKLKDVSQGLTTYYLRSSVLGDAIIQEINSSGQKSVGYVYSSDGALLARQSVAGSNSYITWKRSTPMGTGEHDYNVGGAFGSGVPHRVELDPLGASVPLEYTPPPEVQNEGDIGPGGTGGIFDQRWSNFFDVSGGCTAEGVAASCRDAASALNNLGVMRVNLVLVTIKITYLNGRKPRTMQFITSPNVIRAGINLPFRGNAAVAAASEWNRNLSRGLNAALMEAISAGFREEARAAHRHHAQPQNSLAATLLKPKTPYVDKDVLDNCTQTLYGVKTLEFVGSVKGKGGYFKGNGPLWENAGYDKDFTVRNSVTAFTKAEAKTWVNAYYKDNNISPIPPNYDVYGFTPPFQPELNYTASDLGPMDMLVTQVHELGHSLNNLINLHYPGDLGGKKLEDCVKQNGGFKYR